MQSFLQASTIGLEPEWTQGRNDTVLKLYGHGLMWFTKARQKEASGKDSEKQRQPGPLLKGAAVSNTSLPWAAHGRKRHAFSPWKAVGLHRKGPEAQLFHSLKSTASSLLSCAYSYHPHGGQVYQSKQHTKNLCNYMSANTVTE